MLTLSRSKLEDAARCRRKFYYKHILGLKEQGSSQGASEGTIIHAGLAAVFSYVKSLQDNTNEGLLEEDKAELKKVAAVAISKMIQEGTYEYRGEKQELAPGCQDVEVYMRLTEVVNYYIDNQLFSDLANAHIVAVEHNFVAPVTKDFELEGMLDLVLLRQYPDGKKVYEVYDHKTVASGVDKDLDFLRLDVQFLVYEWIFNQMKEEEYPVEMVYNLIRRDRPPGYGSRELKLNLNGSVSKQNASQDVRDYLRQERVAHSDQELEFVERELISLCQQVDHLTNSTMWPQNFTRTVIKSGGEACSNCEYFSKCSAELVGHGQPNWKFQVTT